MRNDDCTRFKVSILCIAYKRRDCIILLYYYKFTLADPNCSSWSRLSRKFTSVYDKKSTSGIEIPFDFKVPHLHKWALLVGIHMYVSAYAHKCTRDESKKWWSSHACTHIPATDLFHKPAFALFITVILNKPLASLVSRLLMKQ